MSKLGTYAELSAVLHAMKEDIDLGNDTSAEKNILSAVAQLQNKEP
jgi:hypothetical protein